MNKPSLSDFMSATETVTKTADKSSAKQGEKIINMTIRLPQSRWKKLADLSTDERRSIQAIVVEALEAEFTRRGLTL
jgi:hypothetical protein